MRFEAVRLFVERAMAMQASFRHSDQYMPAIVEICRRLDGIPLALELAAARVRALSVEQIAARVNDRFRLLTTGDRTAQPRQQTLRAMIDWSYDLLTEKERILFRRLAVFAGGWTLEAAEACRVWRRRRRVGGARSADRPRRQITCGDRRGRRTLRLLETVRQYADERLNQSGEASDARARHLAFLSLRLAEAARPELDGPDQAAWLTRIDLERENLLAAHAWCDHVPKAPRSGCGWCTQPSHTGSSAASWAWATASRSRRLGPTRDASPARSNARAGCSRPASFAASWAATMKPIAARGESRDCARLGRPLSRIAKALQPLGHDGLGPGRSGRGAALCGGSRRRLPARSATSTNSPPQ